MDKYILESLSFSKEIHAIPIIFSYDDLNCVLFEFNPCAVAKVNSTLNDYNRIFGSMISDYSGAFLITPIDFSYVVIVKNGPYILRFHRKNIYKDKWKDIFVGSVDMYEYDIKEITEFFKIYKL